jgi:hypothetical protein
MELGQKGTEDNRRQRERWRTCDRGRSCGMAGVYMYYYIDNSSSKPDEHITDS